jgi:hypothetical protein
MIRQNSIKEPYSSPREKRMYEIEESKRKAAAQARAQAAAQARAQAAAQARAQAEAQARAQAEAQARARININIDGGTVDLRTGRGRLRFYRDKPLIDPAMHRAPSLQQKDVYRQETEKERRKREADEKTREKERLEREETLRQEVRRRQNAVPQPAPIRASAAAHSQDRDKLLKMKEGFETIMATLNSYDECANEQERLDTLNRCITHHNHVCATMDIVRARLVASIAEGSKKQQVAPVSGRRRGGHRQ